MAVFFLRTKRKEGMASVYTRVKKRNPMMCELAHLDVNNIGKVYRHNNREVYRSIVVYMEDSYHTYL